MRDRELRRPPLTKAQRFCKRAIDIIVAGCGLAVLSPALLLLAIAIKIDSPGPVMYRARRFALSSSDFSSFRFRTMVFCGLYWRRGRPELTDSRFSRVGALIRRTFWPKVPELLNVLRGEMSIVGPATYSSCPGTPLVLPGFKPGLTGWAQINGLADDPAKSIELDIWYLNRWTPWLDITILYPTLCKLFTTRAGL